MTIKIKTRKILTLAFILKGEEEEEEILLGYKKRGFGQGLWNGFGGKVETGEGIKEAAVREIREESGLIVHPKDLEECGQVHFIFKGDPVVLEVHVFRTNKYQGEVTESEEMIPKWWGVKNVPFHKMWPDDEIWYPLILQGIKFKSIFLFQGLDTILGYKITGWDNPNEIIGEMKEKQELLDVGQDKDKDKVNLHSLWEETKALPIINVVKSL